MKHPFTKTLALAIMIVTASLMGLAKMSELPACKQKIRGIASALAWCMDPRHDLDHMTEIGSTTGTVASHICARVFGRVRSS